MTITGQQFGSVRTVGAMNGKTLSCSYKTKYIIAGNWLTAICQIINDLITAFTKNDQFCIFFGYARNDLRF